MANFPTISPSGTPLNPAVVDGDETIRPFVLVDALPVAEQELNLEYRLAVDDPAALAPPGIYLWTGTGWTCKSCFSSYVLPAWSGAVSVILIAGVAYSVLVDGAVVSLDVSLQTDGYATIYGDNGTLYDMPDAPVDWWGLGEDLLAEAYYGFNGQKWLLTLNQRGAVLLGNALGVATA